MSHTLIVSSQLAEANRPSPSWQTSRSTLLRGALSTTVPSSRCSDILHSFSVPSLEALTRQSLLTHAAAVTRFVCPVSVPSGASSVMCAMDVLMPQMMCCAGCCGWLV